MGLPGIAVSGYPEILINRKSLDAGFSSLVPKPFGFEQLRQANARVAASVESEVRHRDDPTYSLVTHGMLWA